MNILIINSWIKLGGAEQLSLELAAYLQNKGHTVTVAGGFVTLDDFDNKFHTLSFLTPPKLLAVLSQKYRVFLLLVGFPVLFFLVLRHAKNYDVLNAHNFPSLWIAGVASFVWKKPVVWECNEPQPIPKVFLFLDKIFLRRVRTIVVLDDKNKQKVKLLYGKDALVVRPGVAFSFWSGGKKEKKKQLLLLAVGKLHPQKNQIMLVDVLKLLHKEFPNLSLVLVGEGEERRRIKERAKALGVAAAITFAGTVDNKTLRDWYHRAFVLCFPALDQTWGLTPFEALCQKTVSIVSSQAGVSEVMKKERIGLIAAPTALSFATKIRYALLHKRELEVIGEKGFQFTKKNISWDHFGKEMLRIFKMSSPT